MDSNITQSLWITLISMALVFASLLLLAGLMSLMTRLFRDQEPASEIPQAGAPLPQDELIRVAVAAVSAALAEQTQSTARPIVPPQPTIIGAWQLGMRTRQMTQKGQMGRKAKE